MPAPATIALSWSQAPGGGACIERPSLIRRLEATVGRRRVLPEEDADTSIHGTVGPAPGGGWLAVIEARHTDGTTFERRLGVESADCRDLDEAIVLVVALMVDSANAGTPALRVAHRPDAAGVAVGADVVLASGMLPSLALGVGIESEATVPPLWPIALWTDIWTANDAMSAGAGARFGAWTAGLGVCPIVAGRPGWAVFACAGATGGAIVSAGVGLNVELSHTRAYVQAEVRAGARLRLAGPLYVTGSVGGAVPVARDTYTYTLANGSEIDVFRTSAVIPLARLALEVRGP